MKVLITGASDGIGRSLAIAMSKMENASVTLVARNEPKLCQVLKELKGTGHRHIIADLTNEEDIAMIVNDISHGQFDMLVNNAGQGQYGLFIDANPKMLTSMILLNCIVPVRLTHAFLQVAKPNSILINTSSLLSVLPMPGTSVYSATKSFLTAFSETLWQELQVKKIEVINLCPGPVETKFHKESGQATFKAPAIQSKTPDQIAAAVVQRLSRPKRTPRLLVGRFNQFLAVIARALPVPTLLTLMAYRYRKMSGV